METTSGSFSLVERKKYDDKTAHQLAQGIWWVGYLDPDRQTSHNPFLVQDKDEAILINPGSRSEKLYQAVSRKVNSVIKSKAIQHIIVLHNDPDRCAALPLFEKIVHRDVRVYAPSNVARSIKHYGCKHPIIRLDGGDSIILKSGRTLDYYVIEKLPAIGTGLLHDKQTNTVFCGNIFGHINEAWNLFAPAGGWRQIDHNDPDVQCSRKALMQALNKLEKLAPERICMHHGPIIEDDIEGYIAAAREINGSN